MKMDIMRGQKKIPFPELRGSLGAIRFPAFAELKLDGELNEFHYTDNGVCYLINKHGTMRYNWNALEQIVPLGVKDMVLVGELIYHDGKQGDLYKLLSNKTNENEIKFVPFDVLIINEQVVKFEPLIERKEMLVHTLKGVEPKVVMNQEDVDDAFQDAIQAGYEGIVVKNMHEPYRTGPCNWVKVKEKDQNDYRVTIIDPVKDRIEVDVNGRGVGVKCMPKDKCNLKVGSIVTVEHQGVLDTGGLRHPVFIKKES